MSNNTRRIVVLDKIDSPRIEQAIFILRDTDEDICRSDAVAEAQRIVDNYLRSMSGENIKERGRKGGKFIFAMTLYTFATVMLTTFVMAMAK